MYQTRLRYRLSRKRSQIRFNSRYIHNRVNSKSLGKLKLDCIRCYTSDLIGANPLFSKLLRSAIQHSQVVRRKPYLLAYNIVRGRISVLICLKLHVTFGLLRRLNDFVKYGSKVLSRWGYSLNWLYTHTRGITPGNSKRGISGYLQNGIVPDELGDLDPPGPFVLSIVYVRLEILINFAIQSLRLTISLRVKRSGHFALYA